MVITPAVAFASWLFGKLNEHVIYGDSVAAAIAMGVMTGMGRAVCASIGAFSCVFANGEKPYRWGFVVAVLTLWKRVHMFIGRELQNLGRYHEQPICCGLS